MVADVVLAVQVWLVERRLLGEGDGWGIKLRCVNLLVVHHRLEIHKEA